MPSTALILQDAQNRSDVVPLARRGTLIHRGPGMTMLQLANLGAKFVSWVSKWAYTGPKDPMSRIVELLGEDDRTQEILDELYAGRIPGRPDALREHCHDLLKFARPGSRPAFDLPRVCAILYLAGILELPTFWANGRSNNQRLLDMLSEISGTMLDLVCDTQETGDGGFDTSASMSVAREDSMKGWYPRACGEAPQVNAILSFSRASPPSNPSDEDQTSRTSHRSLPPAVAPFSLPSDSAPRTPWHTSQVSLPSVIAPSPPSSSSTDPMDVTPFVPPSPSQIASSPPSSPSSAPTNPHVSGMFTNHPSTPWPSYTHIPDPDETPWFGPTPPYVPPIFSTYWPNTPPSGPMPDPDVPGQLIYPDAPHIFQLELSPAVAQDFPIYQPSDDSRARSPSTNAPSPS
ncbi:hypothetical protein C8R46DRAFT_1033076 [Mycena filopes]|nr:hypothetical protein C8R46DRAFT_1033076 [Mycena filopes]